MSGQLFDLLLHAVGFTGPEGPGQDCSFDRVGITEEKKLSKFFRHVVCRRQGDVGNVGRSEVLHLVADETQQLVVSWRGAVVLMH